MNKKRKIAVITSCRADYWLMKSLISLLHNSDTCEMHLIALGAHLSPFHGHTVDFIKRDGFRIAAQMETLTASDTSVGLCKSLGLTVLSATEHLSNIAPDMVVLLGDRYEIMGVAQVAYSLKIPVAHIHGGERTDGALDDVYRHVITKLSCLHFVAHKDYANRVKQLGENPSNIFVVGAACIDQIQHMKHMKRDVLLEALELGAKDKYALISYHPTTLASTEEDESIVHNIFRVLLDTEYKLVVTKANADPRGNSINRILAEYVALHPNRVKLFDTLGGDLNYSAIEHCEFFVGNSSSGIIEVPYFHKPNINIGSRQNGRKRATSTINCSGSFECLTHSVAKMLSADWRKSNVEDAQMVYGEAGNVAKTIYEVISTISLDGLINKQFIDVV